MLERKKQEFISRDSDVKNILASWYDNSKARSETHNVEKTQVLCGR